MESFLIFFRFVDFLLIEVFWVFREFFNIVFNLVLVKILVYVVF